MHPQEENLPENHTITMVSEINNQQSTNEENSSLFLNSILKKGKNEVIGLKSEKSQDYTQKPQ
jgi:hypothetical protein